MAENSHLNKLNEQLEQIKLLAQAEIESKINDENFTKENDYTLEEETTFKENEDPSTYLKKYIEYAEALDNIKTRRKNGKILKWKIKNQKQDVKMRRRYASKAYKFVFMWSCFLFLTILFVGFGDLQIEANDFKWHSKFTISDPVLIALISGVTVNIVAVFVIVIRNLFPVTKVDLEEMEKLAKKSDVGTEKNKDKKGNEPSSD
ncbi:hypothetical protein F3J38_18940 [Pantoea sp. Acro-805]|uniref:Uncharacterized protein n=1 Tax=Candidatus Pantoea formicae TaxID=2608355 RepID=A0ABX0QYU7_9GAMM|nr:hypothetical protein [Pantoea formicae]NIF02112.1 hypothetical protein [Pantoea formicae]